VNFFLFFLLINEVAGFGGLNIFVSYVESTSNSIKFI
jgi:hypothetical protein